MSENINVRINQSVAILIDGNNIELSLHNIVGKENALLDFNKVVPKLLDNRGLSRLIYFREGKSISSKLAERLLNDFHGSVMPCHKSADIPLTIKATQIAKKVDTIIILSGDSDYVELVRHLRGEGVRVEIAAVKQTTARILIEEADHFTPITEEDCYILKSYRSKPISKSNTKKESDRTNKKQVKPTAVAKKKGDSKQKEISKPTRAVKAKLQKKAQGSSRKKASTNSETKTISNKVGSPKSVDNPKDVKAKQKKRNNPTKRR